MSHLLVVDDSPTIRKLVELTFRGTGWTVDFAASGREGIALARSCGADVILLDFVLPDMRGLDVCAKLATDPAAQDTPILLMSAKEESIRSLFKAYPTVIDFVPKPFGQEELLARVRTAMTDASGRPRPTNRVRPRFSHAQKETAAKAVYAKMAKSFALIPSFLAQMGVQSPGGFFARKILTPDLMGDLLEALVPVYRDLLATDEAPSRLTTPAAASTPAETDSPLAGRLKGWPAADICTLLGASGRTGELRLCREGATLIAYFRCGEIVLVTSLDPSNHTSADRGQVAGVPADQLAAAEAEQRASGKPVHVTLAERGVLPAECDLRRLLHRVGRPLLLDALDAREQTFTWRELSALPAYVEAYARYVPISKNTQPFDATTPPPDGTTAPQTAPQSLKQMWLERLRASEAADETLPAPTLVYNRVVGFSEKIREVTLDARERRILALVDGRVTLEDIAARGGLDMSLTRHITRCLEEIGLISRDAPSMPRPVMIMENDAECFQRSLESMLLERSQQVPVLALARHDDVVEAALRERPRAVILSAQASPNDVRDTARALRGREELRGVSLVALLELPAASRAPELTAAGFDAVLVKPVAYADLERWIFA